jgi:DNA-binding PadR family transcriptional regulator
MSARASIGEFEEMVLLSILQVGEDAYGVSILEEIRSRTGRAVLRPAVYVALSRLEEKGMVSRRAGAGAPGRSGRARTFYRVTPSGLEAVRQSRQALLRMWDGLETVLDEGRP